MSRNTRVYIGGLSRDTRTRDVEDEFGRFGRITEIDMRDDYAFVEYDYYRDANDSVYEMDGFKLDGARLSVEHARTGGRDRHRSLQDGRAYGSYYDRRTSTSYGAMSDRAKPNYSSGDGFRGSMYGTKCFNCGKDGHYARDCREGDWSSSIDSVVAGDHTLVIVSKKKYAGAGVFRLFEKEVCRVHTTFGGGRI